MKQLTSLVRNSDKRLAIPIMTHPGIEFIGATVKDAVTDGSVHFNAVKALNQHFPPSAATVIMDLTVEAEAFGAEVVFPEDEIPSVVGRLIEDEAAIEKLQVPDVNSGRVPQYLKAGRLVVDHIKDKPTLAGCIGPFSLAGRLYDMSEMMMLCYSEPDAAKLLLDKCTQFVRNYCRKYKEMGMSGIVIAEPAAGLLSNDGCNEFSSEYIKTIVAELQDDNFQIVLHNCGNTGNCTEAMLATGAKAYHFGNKIDIVATLKECPSDVIVMGNIDPVMFRMETPETLKRVTAELLEKTAGYSNFVLSSGCDTPPHATAKNIQAFFSALDEFNRKR